MIEQIKEQINIVAEARQAAQKASELKTRLRTEWEDANWEVLDLATKTAQWVSETEGALRELTLLSYAETGNKAPVPGVGIREMTKLDYNKDIAFTWAKEHAIALKLDTPAFEKIAKASPLDFVRTFQELQATIATQLEVVE